MRHGLSHRIPTTSVKGISMSHFGLWCTVLIDVICARPHCAAAKQAHSWEGPCFSERRQTPQARFMYHQVSQRLHMQTRLAVSRTSPGTFVTRGHSQTSQRHCTVPGNDQLLPFHAGAHLAVVMAGHAAHTPRTLGRRLSCIDEDIQWSPVLCLKSFTGEVLPPAKL